MTADRRQSVRQLPFTVVPPDSPTARAAVGQYFGELDHRFAAGFAAEEQSAQDVAAFTPPNGLFLVAASDDVPVACGGVRLVGAGDGRYAEIKRMWVHADWRGAGLGSRLLGELERQAAGLGTRIVRLDTNDTLTEAIALYRRAGYRSVPRYNDNPYARLWFEKSLPGDAVST